MACFFLYDTGLLSTSGAPWQGGGRDQRWQGWVRPEQREEQTSAERSRSRGAGSDGVRLSLTHRTAVNSGCFSTRARRHGAQETEGLTSSPCLNLFSRRRSSTSCITRHVGCCCCGATGKWNSWLLGVLRLRRPPLRRVPPGAVWHRSAALQV